jgi:aldehyde:ferredoxin oxidoreductase
MRILRVDMEQGKVASEDLPEEWKLIGGRGLIAKIMNKEVPAECDPLGPQNKLIIACGPLAGTMAPQLGRISVGGKSPLTLGIKESNAGGKAAQKLDRLGIRAVVLEGAAEEGRFYCLEISKDGAVLIPAEKYRGMKNYRLVDELYKKYDRRSAIVSIGIAGERKYKAASVSFTDIHGDPSRNAGRGGLGAVMGSKGLKAIIIDDSGAGPVNIADRVLFKKTAKSWVNTIEHDIACRLYSKYGTPFAVANSSKQGTLPGDNYHSGRPEGFMKVRGEIIQKNLFERGGKMHGCMPGCVVQCSILYPDADGKTLASAYEYEAIGMLGTNLGIADPDAIGRLKFICDDLGLDLIEIGSCLGVAASAEKMKMGDEESAIRLLMEIEQGTEFGNTLANGVVSTAKALNISRIPAIKGQAIPAHDPRAVKGIGVTYATSPMGADHTAGLTYRIPLQKKGQIQNSLRFQVLAATCDSFGYCINSIPGGQASIYEFLADLLNARYGLSLIADHVVEIGKQTLKDELKFNEGAEFSKIYERYPAFVRTEALPPTGHVFDVEDSELDNLWGRLDTFRVPKKIWEVRLPSLPPILFGAGVIQSLGERAKGLNIKNALLIAGPVRKRIGRTQEVQEILENSGITSAVFSDVEPDPPVEEVEKAHQLYREKGCDGFIAVGGGSSLDAAKAIAVRVSQPGVLTEYDSMVGGTAKIRPPIPPLICVPTTSGTGSEVNQYAVITDTERDVKFIIMSNYLIPSLAIIDPTLCRSMPAGLTAESGIDALGHCVEGYVGRAIPYHPYYEALALYGVKLIGRSLRIAYENGEDIDARTDMCMAAINGGICFTKGLGIGHAIAHVLGARYHISHGKAVALGLLCFVRANKEACQEQFSDVAWALDRSDDLETGLVKLYKQLNLPSRLRDFEIPKGDLKTIAFETSKDAANLASNPMTVSESGILQVLRDYY